MDEIRQRIEEQIAATQRSLDFNLYLIRYPNTTLSQYDEYQTASPEQQKQLRREHRDTALEDLQKNHRNLSRLEVALDALEKME